MQDPSDKEIEKSINLCTKMVMRNLATLGKKGISPLAYSKVSIAAALYPLRCAADDDEDFKEAVMPGLESVGDRINVAYGKEVDVNERKAN